MTVCTVYVSPAHRGAGVLDALLAAVETWARGLDGRGLRLDVHEDNAPARAAYARRGFVESGRTEPYPLDRTRRELELVRPLSP